ncbi:MAG: hypothetical protein JNL33_07580 [Betaproteobacteria bacterium]|nr:hypothetical protein [Betaproteobacteria bacterium]
MTVRVWLPRMASLQADTVYAYELLAPDRNVQRRSEGLLSDLPPGRPVELALHALDTVLWELTVPDLNVSRLAQALPGMIEERVLDDIEKLHVACSPRDPRGKVIAAATDRALLSRTLELFARSGHRVRAAVPGPLALPVAPLGWHVRWDGQVCALRASHGMATAFEADGSSVPPELRLMLSQSPPPPSIDVEGTGPIDGWTDVLGVPVARVAAPARAPDVILNLLQHRFAPGLEEPGRWRITAALSVALTTMVIGGLCLDAWMLRAEERSVRERMSSLVRTAFPQVPVVLDAPAQMRALVMEMRPDRNADALIPLAAELARLSATDSIQDLQYSGGVLTATLRGRSREADASFVQAAAASADRGFDTRLQDGVVRIARRQAEP